MPVTIDKFEYATDGAAQSAWGINLSNILTGGTISASSQFNSSYIPAYGGDNNLSTRWASQSYNIAGEWWQYDFGEGVAKIANKAGIYPSLNAYKNFYIKGSNDGTDWTTLYTGITANSETWQYFSFDNSTAYRYYRFYTIDVYSGTATSFYEAQLYLENAVTITSESTIKEEGDYSMKVVAPQTVALNHPLTRTISPTINLTDQTSIKFWIRASRTGTNLKIGFHDSGGTTTESNIAISSADTWEEKTIDISAVANANKDAIDSIIITITNADAENTIYLDEMLGYVTDEGTGGGGITNAINVSILTPSGWQKGI